MEKPMQINKTTIAELRKIHGDLPNSHLPMGANGRFFGALVNGEVQQVEGAIDDDPDDPTYSTQVAEGICACVNALPDLLDTAERVVGVEKERDAEQAQKDFYTTGGKYVDRGPQHPPWKSVDGYHYDTPEEGLKANRKHIDKASPLTPEQRKELQYLGTWIANERYEISGLLGDREKFLDAITAALNAPGMTEPGDS